MTFCLGINLAGGLIGIADTRVVTGTERITARKLWTSPDPHLPIFLLSAGLRSVRDKAISYFEEALATHDQPLDRLFKAVNLYSLQLRRVAAEDREALAAGGLRFDAQALLGGQLSGDPIHRLFLVYSEGNWVEVGEGTPYQIIGETGYGKPILDRTLKFDDDMRFAFKVGCLAFDSTRISAADVDFPIDVVLYVRDSRRLVEQRFAREELQQARAGGRNACATRSTRCPRTGSSGSSPSSACPRSSRWKPRVALDRSGPAAWSPEIVQVTIEGRAGSSRPHLEPPRCV